MIRPGAVNGASYSAPAPEPRAGRREDENLEEALGIMESIESDAKEKASSLPPTDISGNKKLAK